MTRMGGERRNWSVAITRVLAATGLALLLAACGSSGSKAAGTGRTTTSHVARTTIGTLPVITPSTAPTTAAPSTTRPGGTTTTGKDTAPAWFVTPTGNIGCQMTPEGTRCDIKTADEDVRTAADCKKRRSGRNETGLPGFVIRRGAEAPEITCDGPSALGGKRVSNYPASAMVDGSTCAITREGVECRNEEGHGFFLSRGEYRSF